MRRNLQVARVRFPYHGKVYVWRQAVVGLDEVDTQVGERIHGTASLRRRPDDGAETHILLGTVDDGTREEDARALAFAARDLIAPRSQFDGIAAYVSYADHSVFEQAI
jgi:hypothetical protein